MSKHIFVVLLLMQNFGPVRPTEKCCDSTLVGQTVMPFKMEALT